MATFPIRLFGDPVLKQRAREIEEIDGSLATLVDTMYDTMYEAAGIGLAAPQVGIQKRLFTFETEDSGRGVILNPRIVESSGEWLYNEGCLSVPGMHFDIVRPKEVTLQGIDLDGNEMVLEADELLARLFQHEIDHLDGVLLLDRLDPDQRKLAFRSIREHGLTPEPGRNGSAL